MSSELLQQSEGSELIKSNAKVRASRERAELFYELGEFTLALYSLTRKSQVKAGAPISEYFCCRWALNDNG